MLIEGEFGPNSRLTEVALADLLGVSRTPVRDALNTLAQEGLLTHVPNRGYEVRSCTLDDVLGAYDVRETLEALACRRAAEAGLDVRARARLMDALERIDALLASGGWQTAGAKVWRELNSAFHAAIIEAARNISLQRAIYDTQRLPIVISGGGSRWFTHGELVLFFDDAAIRHSQAGHHAIYEALLQRDGDAAAAIMASHIAFACEVLKANWDRPGLFRAVEPFEQAS